MSNEEVLASVLFSRDAGDYDDLRRRLIPCFDDFYGTALKLVLEWQALPTIDVLDVGAGTGMFSAIVQSKCSIGRLCLLDGSAAMLEQARHRFPTNEHVEYRVADMANADFGNEWDLVVSALAIHHLADNEKRDVYRRIRRALKPGGLFINAEQVAGPNTNADERYSRIWLEQVRQLGVSEQEVDKARDRMSYDKCASVSSQLQWLTDAGFSDVDCSFKSWRFAVFSARA
ncbi:class I SAM-dependent methyltransferase (plasmid) [Agrobacterium rosae]|uniref:Class I SAM-dependent methyltransferase n=1 Tax=Agrobacterium rosae TaxID=1972867 RepID=A0ABU4W2S8_9HYPH|nr:class I SAM-dependent methyltransferase [Agrobacterium rosae]MDX8331811.1 class I SAM-dependent methyltransferase [Agrobacterium rosae]